jgi:hypothetical protein
VPNCPYSLYPQQNRLPLIVPGPFVIAHEWESPTAIAVRTTSVPKATAVLVLAAPCMQYKHLRYVNSYCCEARTWMSAGKLSMFIAA